MPARSVIENVYLGIESHNLGFVEAGELKRRYRELNGRAGFDLPAEIPVERSGSPTSRRWRCSARWPATPSSS